MWAAQPKAPAPHRTAPQLPAICTSAATPHRHHVPAPLACSYSGLTLPVLGTASATPRASSKLARPMRPELQSRQRPRWLQKQQQQGACPVPCKPVHPLGRRSLPLRPPQQCPGQPRSRPLSSPGQPARPRSPQPAPHACTSCRSWLTACGAAVQPSTGHTGSTTASVAVCPCRPPVHAAPYMSGGRAKGLSSPSLGPCSASTWGQGTTGGAGQPVGGEAGVPLLLSCAGEHAEGQRMLGSGTWRLVTQLRNAQLGTEVRHMRLGCGRPTNRLCARRRIATAQRYASWCS